MKKLLIVLLAIIASACGDGPPKNYCPVEGVCYRIKMVQVIPDSLRDDAIAYEQQIISAASFHMTGGDYEDPEDLVVYTHAKAEELFSTPTLGLAVYGCSNCSFGDFIPYSELTPAQLKIFTLLGGDQLIDRPPQQNN